MTAQTYTEPATGLDSDDASKSKDGIDKASIIEGILRQLSQEEEYCELSLTTMTDMVKLLSSSIDRVRETAKNEHNIAISDACVYGIGYDLCLRLAKEGPEGNEN